LLVVEKEDSIDAVVATRDAIGVYLGDLAIPEVNIGDAVGAIVVGEAVECLRLVVAQNPDSNLCGDAGCDTVLRKEAAVVHQFEEVVLLIVNPDQLVLFMQPYIPGDIFPIMEGTTFA